MSIETYVRIFAVLILLGWAIFTVPSLITNRWYFDGERRRWSQLPVTRRTDIVRNGGGILVLGVGSLLARNGDLGMVTVLALSFPGTIANLWWGRIDFGNNHILRAERPAPYWMIVLIGLFLSAGAIAAMIWIQG